MGIIYAKMIGILIGMLIVIAFICILWAIILRIACLWVLKIEVPFRKAYTTVLIASTISAVLHYIIEIIIAFGTKSEKAVYEVALLLLPVDYLFLLYYVSLQIRIPIGKACLVVLAMILISLAIGLVIGIPIGLLIIFFGRYW
jgi:hypothetical protein